MTLFGTKYNHLEKLYDGVEISALGDPRDVKDLFFDVKLLTRNAILLKTPIGSRRFFDNYNQISKTFKADKLYDSVMSGHDLVRAAQSNDVNLRIWFVLLKFPDFYQLGNEIFSPDANSNDEKSSDVKYTFSGYLYTYQAKLFKCGNICASCISQTQQEPTT